jgi:hypothetical protein
VKNIIAILFIVWISTSIAYGQPENPNAPVPIDGGLAALAAAGAAYGYRAYRKSKKVK